MFAHLMIDLIGLTLLGLCIAVCIAPAPRPPGRYARDN
jgi:hypothetical protein